MATHPARSWTYAEFARLPDDGNRYEVIDGELCVTPSPRPRHQEMVGRLSDLLRPFVNRHGLGRVYPGPIDVLFAEGDYLAPDLVFVPRDRRGHVTERGVETPPALVVEIVSSSTAFRDCGAKRDRYAHFGVAEYWVVDPQLRRVEVYRGGVDLPEVLEAGMLRWMPAGNGPELEIDVRELFRQLDD